MDREETAEIAGRLAEARGRRSMETQAAKMGISRSRLGQMEAGAIPSAFLYLARLGREGIDLNWLLTGE